MKNSVSINLFSDIPEDDSAKSIEAISDFLSNFSSILATMAAPQYGTSDLQSPPDSISDSAPASALSVG
ncbi:putative conjugative transfer protein [Orientia tsutsugamushi str. UT144]|uniref:Putative conjugative transfer protein n=1 Tax=Orientia tsutsugamushi str. UT144 TaxID=1441384 RepID=A0A0F3RML1_ORITS|nr:putative conjugative transfer protein [Orientia tsutsugamushi str. UT144]